MKYDLEKFSKLIQELENLEEPDLELDAEIDQFLHGGEIVWKQTQYTGETYPSRKIKSEHHTLGVAYEYVSRYTHSLDAAIRTIPKVLTWEIYKNSNNEESFDRYHAEIDPLFEDEGSFRGEGYLLTAAICSAGIKARVFGGLERASAQTLLVTGRK